MVLVFSANLRCVNLKYENVKRQPSIDLFNKPSQYFNVSIDYLLNDEEFKKR